MQKNGSPVICSGGLRGMGMDGGWAAIGLSCKGKINRGWTDMDEDERSFGGSMEKGVSTTPLRTV